MVDGNGMKNHIGIFEKPDVLLMSDPDYSEDDNFAVLLLNKSDFDLQVTTSILKSSQPELIGLEIEVIFITIDVDI